MSEDPYFTLHLKGTHYIQILLMDINAGGTTSGAWQSRAVHNITFLGGTTFSTDQEPHIQGPKVTMSLY